MNFDTQSPAVTREPRLSAEARRQPVQGPLLPAGPSPGGAGASRGQDGPPAARSPAVAAALPTTARYLVASQAPPRLTEAVAGAGRC